MSLGLKRGTVQLELHDKQWDEAAIQTIKILKSILGDDAIDIQHIGSTAIPAIKAKPIIERGRKLQKAFTERMFLNMDDDLRKAFSEATDIIEKNLNEILEAENKL